MHIVTGAVQRGAEHRQVRAALRAGSRGPHARAARLVARGAHRRREGPRRLPGRHRRRHDRHRGVLGRRDPAYRGDPDRRRPDHRTTSRCRCARRRRTPRRSRSATAARCAARESRRDDRGAGVGDRPPRRLSRQTLAEVVEPRYEELFTLVRDELRRSGFEEAVAAGIVLTGGSAKMEGVVELAEEIFHMPVRLGMPQHARRARRTSCASRSTRPAWALLYGRVNRRPARRRKTRRRRW